MLNRCTLLILPILFIAINSLSAAESVWLSNQELQEINYQHNKHINHHEFTIEEITDPNSKIHKALRLYDTTCKKQYYKPALVNTPSRKFSGLTHAYLVLKDNPDEEGQDRYGATPLIAAANWNCFNSAVFLLAYNADPKKENSSGFTPLSSAKQYTYSKRLGSHTKRLGSHIIEKLLLWWITCTQEQKEMYTPWLRLQDNHDTLKSVLNDSPHAMINQKIEDALHQKTHTKQASISTPIDSNDADNNAHFEPASAHSTPQSPPRTTRHEPYKIYGQPDTFLTEQPDYDTQDQPNDAQVPTNDTLYPYAPTSPEPLDEPIIQFETPEAHALYYNLGYTHISFSLEEQLCLQAAYDKSYAGTIFFLNGIENTATFTAHEILDKSQQLYHALIAYNTQHTLAPCNRSGLIDAIYNTHHNIMLALILIGCNIHELKRIHVRQVNVKLHPLIEAVQHCNVFATQILLKLGCLLRLDQKKHTGITALLNYYTKQHLLDQTSGANHIKSLLDQYFSYSHVT